MKPGKIVLSYYNSEDNYRQHQIIHRVMNEPPFAVSHAILRTITVKLTGAYNPEEAQRVAEWYLAAARKKYDEGCDSPPDTGLDRPV